MEACAGEPKRVTGGVGDQMHPLGLQNDGMHASGSAGVHSLIPAPTFTFRPAGKNLEAVGEIVGAGWDVPERVTGRVGGRVHPLDLPNDGMHPSCSGSAGFDLI